MRSLLLFFLLVTGAEAQDMVGCEDCQKLPGRPALGEVPKLSEIATSAQIQSAPCRVLDTSDEQMEDWLDLDESGARRSESIHGVSFENERVEDLEAFKVLTTAVNYFGEPEPGRQRSFSSQCKKVRCALKELFGDTAVTGLYLQRRYGFNYSPIAYEDAQPWKKQELADVLRGIKDMPHGIFPLEKARPLLRFKSGYLPQGYGKTTLADSYMRYFDRWSTFNAGVRQSTVVHELAHVIASKTRADDDPEWLKCSDWGTETVLQNGKPVERWTLGKPQSVVSRYGRTDPGEDFAEAAMAYRYNPQQLLKIAPDKYEYLKRTIFDGVEYLSEEHCRAPVRDSELLRERAQAKLQAQQLTTADLQTQAQSCVPFLLSVLSRGENVSARSEALQKCVSQDTSTLSQKLIREELAGEPLAKHRVTMMRNVQLRLSAEQEAQVRTQAPALLRQRFEDKALPAVWTLISRVGRPTPTSCAPERFRDAANYFWDVYHESPVRNSEQSREIVAFVSRACNDIARNRSATGAIGYEETRRYLRQVFSD